MNPPSEHMVWDAAKGRWVPGVKGVVTMEHGSQVATAREGALLERTETLTTERDAALERVRVLENQLTAVRSEEDRSSELAHVAKLELREALRAQSGYTFLDYKVAAERTLRRDLHTQEYLLANMAIGLAGETGEVCEPIKKHLYHGKPLDATHLALEIGDCLWYLNGLATILGTTLGECAKGNIAKLVARHPTNDVRDRNRAIDVTKCKGGQ
jgi:NTP pyrophosphatase (non-canonical NTP hydrolase)